MGFSRQEYWSGLPCPPTVDLPGPGIKPTLLMSPALAGRFFTTTATCEAHINTDSLIKIKHHGQIFSFSSAQSLSRVRLFVTPWTAACQASLSITNSQSLLKLMSIKSVMPSNYLILCCLLLLMTSIFPSIKVFSNKSALCIRWPKYWSFSFNISPSNEYSGLISFSIVLIGFPCCPRDS